MRQKYKGGIHVTGQDAILNMSLPSQWPLGPEVFRYRCSNNMYTEHNLRFNCIPKRDGSCAHIYIYMLAEISAHTARLATSGARQSTAAIKQLLGWTTLVNVHHIHVQILWLLYTRTIVSGCVAAAKLLTKVYGL